jgi:hypothetical protein
MALQSLYFENIVFEVTGPEASPGVPGPSIDVSCSGRGVVFTPDTPIEDRNKLCGKGKAVGETSWTLDVDYDQDWDEGDAASLSFFLINNNGKQGTVTVTWPAAETEATADILITPGPFGGTAGEVAEGTVSLPVLGQPTFINPIPVTTTASTAEGEQVEDTETHEVPA